MLTARILAPDPSDKEAVAEIGGTLEPLPDSLPDGSQDVAGLLNLTLQALQGLYEETAAGRSAARSPPA